jgi:16S rRNA (uracil1498-N3)-methyltransferase
MPPRFHIDTPLHASAELALAPGAARHVQVLRLQPGAAIILFDGTGGEWSGSVVQMGRAQVLVRVQAFHVVERELPIRVTLAVGMPANERMDALVEKATELGVAVIQPLLCERAVLRLAGERALKKVAHWQAIAVAACEQSGRTRVPHVAPVRLLPDWLAALPAGGGASPSARVVLSAPRPAQAGRPPWGSSKVAEPHLHESLREPKPALRGLTASLTELTSLSGPEGGLTETEERAAREHGFMPLQLGPRTLRADTAPLALLAHLALNLQAQLEGPG